MQTESTPSPVPDAVPPRIPCITDPWFGHDVRVLSGEQPWWWLLLHGKTIENRSRCLSRTYRGWIWLHASATRAHRTYDQAQRFLQENGIPIDLPAFEDQQRGGIIGRARIVDLIAPMTPDADIRARHPGIDTRWHMKDQWGYVLADATPIPFVPHSGGLGLRRLTEPLRQRLVQATKSRSFADAMLRLHHDVIPAGCRRELTATIDDLVLAVAVEERGVGRRLVMVRNNPRVARPAYFRGTHLSVMVPPDQWFIEDFRMAGKSVFVSEALGMPAAVFGEHSPNLLLPTIEGTDEVTLVVRNLNAEARPFTAMLSGSADYYMETPQ